MKKKHRTNQVDMGYLTNAIKNHTTVQPLKRWILTTKPRINANNLLERYKL